MTSIPATIMTSNGFRCELRAHKLSMSSGLEHPSSLLVLMLNELTALFELPRPSLRAASEFEVQHRWKMRSSVKPQLRAYEYLGECNAVLQKAKTFAKLLKW
jgi:hypothetical protein